jgi:hypothetical protein
MRFAQVRGSSRPVPHFFQSASMIIGRPRQSGWSRGSMPAAKASMSLGSSHRVLVTLPASLSASEVLAQRNMEAAERPRKLMDWMNWLRCYSSCSAWKLNTRTAGRVRAGSSYNCNYLQPIRCASAACTRGRRLMRRTLMCRDTPTSHCTSATYPSAPCTPGKNPGAPE